MRFTGLELNDYRCFSRSKKIPLAPLTLIFGPNNSGKSSILHSLLLLRQSLDSSSYGPRLVLRGSLLNAGTYLDLVHKHSVKKAISIQIEIIDQKQETATIDLNFGDDGAPFPRLTMLRISGSKHAPLRIQCESGAEGAYHLFIDSEDLGNAREANFSFPVNGFLPLIGEEPPRKGRSSQIRERTRQFARNSIELLRKLLTDMRAIGPFRQPPKRDYEESGTPEVADINGGNVVDILIQDHQARGKKKGNLGRSVNEWLERIAHVELKLTKLSANLFQIRMLDLVSKQWSNFADVGFGIGQALPVLIEGLRTPVGGIFLVQEPEIHLHPDAQLIMADFLIALAQSGRQVIVETHSEHLLLRVRRQVVVAGIDELHSNAVSIVHIGKRKNGESFITPLHMDELATINNWPPGFLQEATDERMKLLENIAEKIGNEE